MREKTRKLIIKVMAIVLAALMCAGTAYTIFAIIAN